MKYKLLIEEEFGYRWWLWQGDQDPVKLFEERTQDLDCSSDVQGVFPGAVEIDDDDADPLWFEPMKNGVTHIAHLHDEDDSYVEPTESWQRPRVVGIIPEEVRNQMLIDGVVAANQAFARNHAKKDKRS